MEIGKKIVRCPLLTRVPWEEKNIKSSFYTKRFIVQSLWCLVQAASIFTNINSNEY